MKHLFSLVISCYICVACQNNVTDSNPEIKQHYYHTNRRIVGKTDSSGVGYLYTLASGDLLVFERYYKRAESKEVMDDEYQEKFAFQVNPAIVGDSFLVADTLLYSFNPVLGYHCYCYREGSIKNIKGAISGEKKSDGAWDVKVDVKFVYYTTNGKTDTLGLKFSEIFILKK